MLFHLPYRNLRYDNYSLCRIEKRGFWGIISHQLKE